MQGEYRILRGGSWLYLDISFVDSKVSYRLTDGYPYIRISAGGFRLVQGQ
jgi:hypothetical protein